MCTGLLEKNSMWRMMPQNFTLAVSITGEIPTRWVLKCKAAPHPRAQAGTPMPSMRTARRWASWRTSQFSPFRKHPCNVVWTRDLWCTDPLLPLFWKRERALPSFQASPHAFLISGAQTRVSTHPQRSSEISPLLQLPCRFVAGQQQNNNSHHLLRVSTYTQSRKEDLKRNQLIESNRTERALILFLERTA